MSLHMKDLGFIYLSYKRKDLALNVLDTNNDYKNKWFFINPNDLKVDWAFPTIGHKNLLINSSKEVTRWS